MHGGCMHGRGVHACCRELHSILNRLENSQPSHATSAATHPPQVAGVPVPTQLMNVLLRAIALLKDNASAAARAFETFPLYGAAHDVDSYNCIMESCAAAGKVWGAAGGEEGG
jgi:hypothetical protein